MRVGTAAGAGLLLYVGAPPRELWWLAPVVFAVLWAVLHGRPARAGFGYGLAFGLGFFVPLLSWAGEFVGPLPWLALATVEALVLALAGAGVAVVSRLPAAPLWAAGVWVAAEALIGRAPFGGFPWGRVAFGQPSGIFLPLAAIGGAPLLTAAVVLTGFGAGELLRRVSTGSLRPLGSSAVEFGRLRTVVVPALLAGGPLVAGILAAPMVATTTTDGSAVVALVQGNVPRAGLDFNAQRRAVLDNHVARTMTLAADVAAGRYPRPALVIWPENSSDIDPLRNPDARAVIDRAARAIGVPILVGAVLRTGDGHTTNTAMVWNPRTGPGQRHDKRPMPFAEYIPYRNFFRLFSPYVDRAGDFVPGNGDSAVDVGPARVGIAICSEVMFDDLVRQGVQSGAQLLAVPTNNATFGFTEMTYQQQAISRVRAVEHGRTVLVAATSGVSAVIAPDGAVEQQTKLFTPDALVARVPLRSGTTLATRLGPTPEWLLVTLGLLGVAAALVVQSRAKAGQRRGPVPPKEDVDGGSAGRWGRRGRRPDDRGDPDLRRAGQPADGPAPAARGGT
ncbi:MAG: Apolipoprotein N-acyltransferase [Pseudonocardiales bacterium]|jgi:apolipoprotein N-acyltransferase|nr:Apolipoprotein N-acyltransferase [Pseudonocardiales bacterium]